MTILFVKYDNRVVLDVEVIEETTLAAVVLEPLRARILASLQEPGSATTVAKQLGEPRQKVNYHLRLLEENGLVEFVGERQRRGLAERLVVATARSYVVSPAALPHQLPDPSQVSQLSARYLVAVAARLLREVGSLTKGATRAGKPLATLTIDTEVRFASADDRARFGADLTEAVTRLVAEYHDEAAEGGREHRLVVAAHPKPKEQRADDT